MPRGIPNNPKSKKGPKPGTKYKKRNEAVKQAEAKSAGAVNQTPPRYGDGLYSTLERFQVLQGNLTALNQLRGAANPYQGSTLLDEELTHNLEALRELRLKTFGPTTSEITKQAPTKAADPVAAASEDDEEEDDEDNGEAPAAPKFAAPAIVPPVPPS